MVVSDSVPCFCAPVWASVGRGSQRPANTGRSVRRQSQCDGRPGAGVNQRTLGDVLESLVGSHDCDVESAEISRSKPGLDLEIQKVMVG